MRELRQTTYVGVKVGGFVGINHRTPSEEDKLDKLLCTEAQKQENLQNAALPGQDVLHTVSSSPSRDSKEQTKAKT